MGSRSAAGRFGPAVAILLLISGCGLPANVAVLIPDEDGTVGHATIANASGTVPLDQSFAAVGAPSSASLAKGFVADKADVDKEFRSVLGATPRAPVTFVMTFVSGEATLAPGARAVLDAAVAQAKATPNADISVVGHSDRTGTPAANLDLSLRRATVIRDLLVAAGIDPGILAVGYHGANNPAVKTAAGVAEARNRRVEITIR